MKPASWKRIRDGIYLFTDRHGKALQFSTGYQELGIDQPGDIQEVIREQKARWSTRVHAHRSAPVLIRAGVVYDETRTIARPYFVAIGRNAYAEPDSAAEFHQPQMWLLPLIADCGLDLGWLLAGLTLRPVLAVAQTAQRITGSNLSLRIPARGAGDELDYLILTFNRMIERLESSFQQIRQFSTDVSHELRTPITAIRGQLEVAMFTAHTPEQYQEAILNSLQDVERLSQIVRALLLLSQAESGQVVLQKDAAGPGLGGARHRRPVSDSGGGAAGPAGIGVAAWNARWPATVSRSSACFPTCSRTP